MNKPSILFQDKIIHRIKMIMGVLLILVIVGITIRIIEYITLSFSTKHQAVLTVATIKPASSPATVEIVLPGNVQAWHETTIYARTNGYIVKWMVDIGDHVKQGDLLAEISTPEVNAQLRQAEADLKTAKANHHLAITTANRWTSLLKTDSVSKQETDEKVSNAKATAAMVKSTQANRDRLRDLVNFERIIAPFDGVIMSRTTDIGNLINAGSGTVPLFRLVQSDPLRVYIRVPEYYAENIVSGITAQLFFPQLPGKSYSAALLGTAKAIEPVSRTLLVQLQVNNPNYELLAGSYAEVHLKLPAKTTVLLPVNTLIFRSKGMQVATVDRDNKVILKSIVIGHDFGDAVEVLTGLQPNETVILNPPDSLLNGQKVRIISSTTFSKDMQK